MKILLVNFEYPPLGGGGGVATAQIAQELAGRHEVHVLTTKYGELPQEEILMGVHIHRVRVWGRKELPTATLISLITFAPSAFIRGISLFRKHAFDVIHAQFVIPSGLPAAFLAKIFAVPFVLTFIGGDIYDPSKFFSPHKNALLRAIIRWVARQAHAMTAISNDTKTRTIELHGVTENISVIPIGLVPLREKPISRSEIGVPEDAFLCVSIGRLVPRKGYDVLLKAWEKIPNAHLLIIGDGPMKTDLLRRCELLGLSNRVSLLGHVTEKRKQQLLASADLYVSAAQHEGFGIVFLEAMDAGLPIVAANDGGQRDFLQHGEHAILVAPHDSDGIAKGVQLFMNDPALRTKVGKRNSDDVRQYYISTTARKFEHILIDTVQVYEHRN